MRDLIKQPNEPIYVQKLWTPELKFGGANTGMTYVTQTGYATRIGNIAVMNAVILLSAKGSSTGVATVTGWPYVPVMNQLVYIGTGSVTTTAGGQGVGFWQGSKTTMEVGEMVTGVYAQISDTAFSGNEALYISVAFQI